jgi:hypothetical protein
VGGGDELTVVADLAVYAAGALILGALVRWWRPELGVRAIAGYSFWVVAFLAPTLLTGRHLVATDIAYQWRPWRGSIEQAVTPANTLLSDPLLQMLPFRAEVRRQLLAGTPPLWSAELGTGQPLLGNAQAAPFAPLHLMALPLPPLRALGVAAAWQMLLALLLAHCLARRLGAGPTGAAFGAIAFGCSSFMVAWLLYPLGMTAAWLPGVLLSLVLLHQGERGGFAGLTVCALGMAVSGHPETLAHTAIAAGVVAAGLALRAGAVPRRRFLARGTGAALLATALAAPALLPVLETLPHSERMAVLRQHGLDAVSPPPFRADLLRGLVTPLAWGSPRDGNWSGPSNFNEAATAWAGALTLAIGLAAAVRWRRHRAWLAGGALALAVALRVPGVFDLFAALPGLGQGAHGRLRVVWILTVAMAAAVALEELARHPAARRWGLSALALCALALASARPAPEAPWQVAWWLCTLAGLGAVAAALALPRLRQRFPQVAVVALAVELALFGVRYNPAVPGEHDLRSRPLDFVSAARRPQAPSPRVLAEEWDLLPNLASLWQLGDPRGNDPMRPAAAARFVAARVGSRQGPGEAVLLRRRPWDQPALDFLGVEYLFTWRDELPEPWRKVHEGYGAKVFHNPEARPLFFVPPAVELARDPRHALELGIAAEDPGSVAFVPPEAGLAASPQEGTVVVERSRSDRYRLNVRTASGALVASTISVAPGWRVRRGGAAVAVVPVHGAFVGFWVPPGDHQVELHYRPRSWSAALALAALGLTVVAALAVGSRRARS